MLVNDATRRRELAMHGHYTILSRHTCAHRVDELLRVHAELTSRQPPAKPRVRQSAEAIAWRSRTPRERQGDCDLSNHAL